MSRHIGLDTRAADIVRSVFRNSPSHDVFAILTAILWTALAFFSSLYFSSALVEDSKTYGTIGVSFTFLTWFVLISAVIMAGAAGGAVWEARRGRSG